MSDKKVITLICERACDLSSVTDADGEVKEVSGLHVVKLPCSGMIQTSMISAALKAGAAGVIVTGCQLGDCYYREGNRMIRDRLLGTRPPGLKKDVDRRRVLALWLARPQKDRFLSEAKEFLHMVRDLPAVAAAPAAPAKAEVKAAPAKAEAVKAEAVKANEDVKAGDTKAPPTSTPPARTEAEADGEAKKPGHS